MSRTKRERPPQHFVDYLSRKCAQFAQGGGRLGDKVTGMHPLAAYFEAYKTHKGSQMDYALVGNTKWVSVKGRERQCRALNAWQRDFVRKFEAVGGEGVATWDSALGVARGTSMSRTPRGRRTAVQLTLPLIWKRQTSTKATRAIPATA